MRVARIVAAFSFVGGLWSLLGLLIVGGSVLQEGQFSLCISLVMHAVLGIFTGIQLWRLKPSERIMGIMLFTYMIVYYMHDIFFPAPRTSIPSVVILGGIYLMALLTLLIGPAKQIGISMPSREASSVSLLLTPLTYCDAGASPRRDDASAQSCPDLPPAVLQETRH